MTLKDVEARFSFATISTNPIMIAPRHASTITIQSHDFKALNISFNGKLYIHTIASSNSQAMLGAALVFNPL